MQETERRALLQQQLLSHSQQHLREQEVEVRSLQEQIIALRSARPAVHNRGSEHSRGSEPLYQLQKRASAPQMGTVAGSDREASCGGGQGTGDKARLCASTGAGHAEKGGDHGRGLGYAGERGVAEAVGGGEVAVKRAWQSETSVAEAEVELRNQRLGQDERKNASNSGGVGLLRTGAASRVGVGLAGDRETMRGSLPEVLAMQGGREGPSNVIRRFESGGGHERSMEEEDNLRPLLSHSYDEVCISRA